MANYEPDDGALTAEQIEQIKKLNMNDLKFTTAGNYMDTKLEDLMYRSGLTASGCWDQLDEYDRKAIEKFGELIVRECIEINKQELSFNAFERLLNRYQENFGVKG